jgi:hypothetical protein
MREMDRKNYIKINCVVELAHILRGSLCLDV